MEDLVSTVWGITIKKYHVTLASPLITSLRSSIATFQTIDATALDQETYHFEDF
jgi:hypothetical protein